MAILGKPIRSAAFTRTGTQAQDRAQTLADMLGGTLVQKEVPKEEPTEEIPVAKPKRTRTKKTVD